MFRYLLTLFSFVHSNDLASQPINLSSKWMFYNNNTFLRAEARFEEEKFRRRKLIICSNIPNNMIQDSYTLYDATHSTWMFYNVRKLFSRLLARTPKTLNFYECSAHKKTVLSSIEHQKHNLSCIRNCCVECDVRICLREKSGARKKCLSTSKRRRLHQNHRAKLNVDEHCFSELQPQPFFSSFNSLNRRREKNV